MVVSEDRVDQAAPGFGDSVGVGVSAERIRPVWWSGTPAWG